MQRHSTIITNAAGLEHVMGTVAQQVYLGTYNAAMPPANPIPPIPSVGGCPMPVASANVPPQYLLTGWESEAVPDVLAADGVTVLVAGTIRQLHALLAAGTIKYYPSADGYPYPTAKQEAGWVEPPAGPTGP